MQLALTALSNVGVVGAIGWVTQIIQRRSKSVEEVRERGQTLLLVFLVAAVVRDCV